MKHILCVILLLLVSFTEATASDPFCVGTSSPRTLIVFGNGIMTDHEGATASRVKVEKLLHATLPPEEFNQLDFDLAENKTYGKLNDLYESAKQKALSDNVATSFWRWMGGLDIMPDFFQTEMLRISASFDFSTMVGSDDLNEHLALYRDSISAGKNVVDVAHSQGNFFANAAWTVLFGELTSAQMKGFGIVSVANPASFVGGGGPHTTLKEDKIINAVRLLIQDVSSLHFTIVAPMDQVDTNIGSPMVHKDFFRHGFEDEYVAQGSNTVDIIVQNIVAMIHSRVHPPSITSETAISITLTPGTGKDTDLHVQEPSGVRITSVSPTGTSGKFDVVDSAGYGPERYVVSCSKLAGNTTYTVLVSYPRGVAPISATLAIKAGSIVSNYTLPILPSWAVPLYDLAIPVAQVHVLGYTDARGYEFFVSNVFGAPLTPPPLVFHYGAF